MNGEERILRRGDAMIVPEFIPHSFGLADGCGASQHFIAHALTGDVAGANPFGCFASPFLHPEHTEAVLTRLETIVAVRNTSPDARAKRDETAVQGADARGGAGGTLPLFGSAAERRAHCVGPCVHQREFRRLHRGCRHRGACPARRSAVPQTFPARSRHEPRPPACSGHGWFTPLGCWHGTTCRSPRWRNSPDSRTSATFRPLSAPPLHARPGSIAAISAAADRMSFQTQWRCRLMISSCSCGSSAVNFAEKPPTRTIRCR